MLHNFILTTALIAALVPHLHAFAAAARQPAAPVLLAPRAGDLDAWVTVGPNGAPSTIQPQVTSVDGTTKTISPAPTATYTTTRDGKTMTTTGRAPAPTADSESGAGSFVFCDQTIGEYAPFCTPEDGSILYVGNTYYITWAPGYFANFSDDIDVEGYYSDGRMVFEHNLTDVGIGFYAWTVPESLLEGSSSGSKAIQLHIEYKGSDEVSGSQTRRNIPGPHIAIALSHSENTSGSDGGGSLKSKSLAIAVPVIIVFGVLAGLAFFFWKRRRAGGGGIRLSGFGFNRRSSGYGVRQSRSQRTGENDGMPGLDNKGPAYQLQDSPTSPGTGRNVFREEIRRQEES